MWIHALPGKPFRGLLLLDAAGGGRGADVRQPAGDPARPSERLRQNTMRALARSARPPALRERLVPVARWEHIPGYLPPQEVLRSWLTRDRALLFEPMLAMQLGNGTAAR